MCTMDGGRAAILTAGERSLVLAVEEESALECRTVGVSSCIWSSGVTTTMLGVLRVD